LRRGRTDQQMKIVVAFIDFSDIPKSPHISKCFSAAELLQRRCIDHKWRSDNNLKQRAIRNYWCMQFDAYFWYCWTSTWNILESLRPKLMHLYDSLLIHDSLKKWWMVPLFWLYPYIKKLGLLCVPLCCKKCAHA